MGLLGGQEKGSEGYRGDGISIKDGMVEPLAVRSNCGSCWGFEEAPLADMDKSTCSCSCASEHLGFEFSGLGPENSTSNRGSWLLGKEMSCGSRRRGKPKGAPSDPGWQGSQGDERSGQGLRIGRRIRLYRVQQRCEPSRLEYLSSVHWSLITLVLC
jgi:hypothetical protein